jgi:TolA-binding protein
MRCTRQLLWLLVALAPLVSMIGCMATQPREYSIRPEPHPADPTRLEQEIYEQAMVLVAEQRYEEALRRLVPLPPAFEKAEDWNRAAAAYFWMGYCNEKQGRLSQAIDLYRHVTHLYGTTPASRQAGDRLAILVVPREPAPKPAPPPTDKT